MRRTTASAAFIALTVVAVGHGGAAAGEALRIVDLGVGGVPDGVAEQFTVVGSPSADVIAVAGSPAAVTIVGVGLSTLLTGFDPFDTLVVDAGGGTDLVDASGLDGGALHLDLRAGSGDEGADEVVWTAGAGQDVVDGGGDVDTLTLRGDVGRPTAVGAWHAWPEGPWTRDVDYSLSSCSAISEVTHVRNRSTSHPQSVVSSWKTSSLTTP